jgi:hypothetical protein
MRADGIRVPALPAMPYARELVAAGLHDGEHLPYIQQEGTFWKRTLWEQAGGRLREDLKYAGDFDLWMRLAEIDELFSCEVSLGCFRVHAGQKTGNLGEYEAELRRHRSRVRGEVPELLWRRYLDADDSFAGNILSFTLAGSCQARVSRVRYRSLRSLSDHGWDGAADPAAMKLSPLADYGITIDRDDFAQLAQRSRLLEDIERDSIYRIRRRMLRAEKRLREWLRGLRRR